MHAGGPKRREVGPGCTGNLQQDHRASASGDPNSRRGTGGGSRERAHASFASFWDSSASSASLQGCMMVFWRRRLCCSCSSCAVLNCHSPNARPSLQVIVHTGHSTFVDFSSAHWRSPCTAHSVRSAPSDERRHASVCFVMLAKRPPMIGPSYVRLSVSFSDLGRLGLALLALCRAQRRWQLSRPPCGVYAVPGPGRIWNLSSARCCHASRADADPSDDHTSGDVLTSSGATLRRSFGAVPGTERSGLGGPAHAHCSAGFPAECRSWTPHTQAADSQSTAGQGTFAVPPCPALAPGTSIHRRKLGDCKPLRFRPKASPRTWHDGASHWDKCAENAPWRPNCRCRCGLRQVQARRGDEMAVPALARSRTLLRVLHLVVAHTLTLLFGRILMPDAHT